MVYMKVVCVLVHYLYINSYLGKAAELAQEDLQNGHIEKIRALRTPWEGLQAELDELHLNGSGASLAQQS